MKTLAELADQHSTDKAGHGYCPHYEARFAPMQGHRITLLEIGVLEGASLRMWRDYFPEAWIVGIDKAPQWRSDDVAITIETGDQADVPFLAQCCAKHGPFDIVIDDGSHQARDQLTSFGALWSRLWGALRD